MYLKFLKLHEKFVGMKLFVQKLLKLVCATGLQHSWKMHILNNLHMDFKVFSIKISLCQFHFPIKL